MTEISKINLSRFLSPVLFFILWYAVAAIMQAPLILPYPHDVIVKIISRAQTALFWKSFACTFLRVIYAFLISLVLGFFTGLLSADFSLIKAILEFPIGIIRITPIIACILFALFWFKSSMVPVFAAVLMALPVIISAGEKGFEKNPENIDKLFKASCYGFTGFRAFRYIRLPAAMPSLLAGAESAFGLCWKVVAAGEVLSLPRFAAGTLMQKAQVHLETSDVIAITTMLVLFSMFCQFVMKIMLKKISSKNPEKAL